MKKKSSRLKRGAAASSKLALVAGMLAAPALTPPALAVAQQATQQRTPPAAPAAPAKLETVYIKMSASVLKVSGTYSIAGMDGSHTVYKDMRGRMFYFDPGTGDMKFLSADYVHKLDIKDAERVTIVGMDARGNMVQQNNKGEKFYLDPNGKMVFVK